MMFLNLWFESNHACQNCWWFKELLIDWAISGDSGQITAFGVSATEGRGHTMLPRVTYRTILAAMLAFLVGCGTAAVAAASPDDLSSTAATHDETDCPAGPRRCLKVALYPFLPDYKNLFSDIEHGFEREHPDIDLQIIDLSNNYYNENAEKAITNTAAQVYELDGVFLADFVEEKLIRPLPATLVPAANSMIPVAESSAKVGTDWWGVPHWVCTNYLFFRAGDQLESASTLKDIESLIGVKHAPDKGLLIDAKGKSTLGELYLDATIDEVGNMTAAAPYLLDTNLLGKATEDIKRAVSLCDTGLCRDADYHEATGFYARQFSRKRGRALVGYSERLYYIALEQQESCRKGECISLRDVEVKPFPLSDRGSHPFAWVDMLAISSGCEGQCLTDATAFIAYVTRAGEVKRSLLPSHYGAPPRYLLPARADLYTDKDILAVAPLYSKLGAALSGAIPVGGQKINAHLRAIGRKLDEEILKP